MLLGLALAPLADQHQDDAKDAEVEGQVLMQQTNLPMSQNTVANVPQSPAASPLMPKHNDDSVDAAAKKVLFAPLPFRFVVSRFFQAAQATARSKSEAEAMAKASLEAARNKADAAR